MEKSLIAQIAEIQKTIYDFHLIMSNYMTSDGRIIFAFDMGEYSSHAENPDNALRNLIREIVKGENS